MAFEKLAGHGNALLGFFQLKQMRRFRDEIVVHFIGGPLVERGQVRVRQGGVGADDLLRTGDKIEIEQRKETPAVFHELRFVFTGAEEFDPRAARILPLSGKSHAALGELAGEYRSWLDDHAEELSEEGETLDQLLADMTWTAGIGRSHFTHRAGVVFSDAGSLRDGLEALVEAGEGSEPRVAAKAAFVYTGQDSQWVGMGEALYRSEPVIRAVLDQCDAWLQEERGVSLLDVMFGRSDSKGSLDDPAWAQPAIYALECALTAWWLSMGVRPSAVIGHDLGEIAAAQAAGVFSLKDGLLFAAARGADELETIFSDIAIAPPSITLISSTMGRTVGPDEILDATYWREQASKPAELKKCAEALSDFGIEGLVEIGPREAFGSMLASAWPGSAGDAGGPALISSLHEPSGDEPVEDIYRKFVGALAEVYEAGLPISFQGLFAGEARRRISLPGYPFQRRHHWIKASGR
ncbi:MAG: acyltransferase domain-containing protein [Gammaproteobacteria bacterium]|nr:acyltransferase domain-containing protein [Gammaproteobacteria bacterium]